METIPEIRQSISPISLVGAGDSAYHKVMARIITLVILLLSLMSTTASLPQTAGSDTTIRYIARSLDRFGEKALAQRLLKDYFLENRVSLKPLDSNEENAYVTQDDNGRNVMVITDNALEIARSEKLIAKRPYHSGSSLLTWTLTVYHEYIHMDQILPETIPKFEDPAWQATDKAIERWTKLLENELAAALGKPVSATRKEEVQQILDAIVALKSELGTFDNDVLNGVANGILSPGQKWTYLTSLTKLRELEKKAKAAMAATAPPASTTNPATPPLKPGEKAWVRISVKEYNEPSPNENYSYNASDGQVQMRWGMGTDTWHFTCTWDKPPRVIRKTDKIPITMSIKVDKNVGESYSANGAFVLVWDRPEVEPGVTIDGSLLRGAKGEKSVLNVTHRMGVPPEGPVTVYIDGSTLPNGMDGAQIALLADVYNGRSSGVKYIYEWKVPD